MAKRTAHFSPALFTFFRGLARNNQRAWFLENKDRYEKDVKATLLRFIEDFAPKLKKIAPNLVADEKSMFRIYRDTRFSRDKTPYKTHAAAHFRHKAGKDVHAPGFYMHLEPGEVFVGGGLWRPDAPAATQVRKAIARDPKGWKKASASPAFRKKFDLEGESLKRPPRGFPEDHPAMEDLMRKDWIAVLKWPEKRACSASFLDDFADACRTAAPFMAFLTKATGHRW